MTGATRRSPPVIPLFRWIPASRRSLPVPPCRHPRRTPRFEDSGDGEEPPAIDDDRARSGQEEDDVDAVDPEQRVKTATDRLLRKLGSRGLSVSEATDVLAVRRRAPRRGIDRDRRPRRSRMPFSDEPPPSAVHAALTRNKDGRRGIAQKLAKCGIARDVADAALAELPDDDAERALEFARTKARSMGGLDRDTAIRRLSGHLCTTQHPGHVSLTAARAALDEAGQQAERRPLPLTS